MLSREVHAAAAGALRPGGPVDDFQNGLAGISSGECL